MLRDNRGHAHYPSKCYGGTHLPSSTWFTGSGQGKVSCTSTLECGVLVLPSPLLRAQLYIDTASEVGCHISHGKLWGQHTGKELCWLQNSGPEDLCLALQFRGSSGMVMGPVSRGEGCRGWGHSLWAILGYKVQYLSKKICYSFPGWDICYLSLCLQNQC
jgi:hypothetical protein